MLWLTQKVFGEIKWLTEIKEEEDKEDERLVVRKEGQEGNRGNRNE